LLEAPAERIQTAEPPLHPATHQPPERGIGRVARQDVVRQLLQDVGRSDVAVERIL
jgi:hypothetical protein